MGRQSGAAIRRQLDELAEVVRAAKSGLSRSQIRTQYEQKHRSIADRTLQRRLEQLVRLGRVDLGGEGPSTVYRPLAEPKEVTSQEEDYVPLSRAGKEVRDLVRRPLSEKEPIGYDPDWLLSYEPGKTWYLPDKTRQQLHNMGRAADGNRPAGTYAQAILDRLLIDLSWASSRLEGNTYSRLDTQNLLEFGQRAAGKDVEEAQMILNHKSAIEFLVDDPESVGFDRRTLLTLHAALSENLLGNPADEGRLREAPVGITKTTYTPTAIPQVIQECFDHILRIASAIPDAFEQSFFAMVHLPYLQPFVDVNKRTSRLAANIPLIRANLCPLSFIDVPEQAYVEGTLGVYENRRTELLRDVFVWTYERSAKQYRVLRESLPPPDPIRLRYRSELGVVIAETIRSGAPPRQETLLGSAVGQGVEDSHKEKFAEAALAILLNLNEGSAGRYVTPTEFRDWRSKFEAAKTEST